MISCRNVAGWTVASTQATDSYIFQKYTTLSGMRVKHVSFRKITALLSIPVHRLESVHNWTLDLRVPVHRPVCSSCSFSGGIFHWHVSSLCPLLFGHTAQPLSPTASPVTCLKCVSELGTFPSETSSVGSLEVLRSQQLFTWLSWLTVTVAFLCSHLDDLRHLVRGPGVPSSGVCLGVLPHLCNSPSTRNQRGQNLTARCTKDSQAMCHIPHPLSNSCSPIKLNHVQVFDVMILTQKCAAPFRALKKKLELFKFYIPTTSSQSRKQ